MSKIVTARAFTRLGGKNHFLAGADMEIGDDLRSDAVGQVVVFVISRAHELGYSPLRVKTIVSVREAGTQAITKEDQDKIVRLG